MTTIVKPSVKPTSKHENGFRTKHLDKPVVALSAETSNQRRKELQRIYDRNSDLVVQRQHFECYMCFVLTYVKEKTVKIIPSFAEDMRKAKSRK